MIALALLLHVIVSSHTEKLTAAEKHQLAQAHTEQQKREAESIIAHNHRADVGCGCYVGQAPVTWKIKDGVIVIQWNQEPPVAR